MENAGAYLLQVLSTIFAFIAAHPVRTGVTFAVIMVVVALTVWFDDTNRGEEEK